MKDKFFEPITLLSYGRSGTSLLSAMLSESPDVDFVGETAQLLFYTWRGAERSMGVSRGRPPEIFCGEAVRAVFRGVCPSDKPIMLHKPIGIPQVFWILKSEKINAADWYWRALNGSFPEGRFLTILRNPIDVAISGSLYWKFDMLGMLRQLGEMAELLMHKDSKIRIAVEYDRLIADPEGQLKSVCDAVGIEYDASMLAPLQQAHAPHRADAVAAAAAVDAMQKCLVKAEVQVSLGRVAEMWRTFGAEPGEFASRSKYMSGRLEA